MNILSRQNIIAQADFNRWLIVPAALQTKADDLIENLVAPDQDANRLRVVTEPLLDVGSPGSSLTAFYLAANVNQMPTIEVAFLEGSEEPAIFEENDFQSDNRRYKIQHVVGARAVSWQGFYKDAGV